VCNEHLLFSCVESSLVEAYRLRAWAHQCCAVVEAVEEVK